METLPPPPRNQFKVYVFPHVQKFMKKTFANKSGIFRTEETHTLGKIVTLALLDNRSWKDKNNLGNERTTKTIILELNSQQSARSPRFTKLQRINIDIDGIFKEHLLMWIRGQQAIGSSVRASCISFLEHYNIDSNEYSLDNAYKVWQRQNAKEKW